MFHHLCMKGQFMHYIRMCSALLGACLCTYVRIPVCMCTLSDIVSSVFSSYFKLPSLLRCLPLMLDVCETVGTDGQTFHWPSALINQCMTKGTDFADQTFKLLCGNILNFTDWQMGLWLCSIFPEKGVDLASGQACTPSYTQDCML